MTPYYEPEGGGLERYAHQILNRLGRRGHEVRALSFTRSGLGDGTRGCVQVERLRPRLRLGNTPVDPALRGRVATSIGRARPDVVVAHTPVPFAAEMAYLAARAARVPFVATYHAGTLRGSTPALDGLALLNRLTIERRMLAGARRLIAVGPFVRDHALAGHRDRVTIVPPGVDAKRFAPDGAPRGQDILFVGPLSRSYRWKGVDVLWRAFLRVRKRFPTARLVLVGEGDRYAEFLRRGKPLGGSVRLPGRLSDPQLARQYRQAAVVALPSTTDAESFGMVLAEANSCGRPVVASRIGGIPDFVRDGDNGFLARPGDAGDLAQKIETLLGDPTMAEQMGQRGRQRVVREHDWDALASATERVLQGAVWKDDARRFVRA